MRLLDGSCIMTPYRLRFLASRGKSCSIRGEYQQGNASFGPIHDGYVRGICWCDRSGGVVIVTVRH